MTSSFFLLINTMSGIHTEVRWSICISKFQIISYLSFSRMDSSLCIYCLLVWSNFNFLHNSQWITLPTQSCLILYSFSTSLLHVLIWLIVSSLSPHNIRLHTINFCFNIIGSFGIVLSYYNKRVSLSLEVSFS